MPGSSAVRRYIADGRAGATAAKILGGVRLGQRHLLTIVRAFIAKLTVLVLD